LATATTREPPTVAHDAKDPDQGPGGKSASLQPPDMETLTVEELTGNHQKVFPS